MVHFFTLSHTFATLRESYSHFGKVRKCDNVTPNLGVEKAGKKSVLKIRNQSTKKIHFFKNSAFPQPPDFRGMHLINWNEYRCLHTEQKIVGDFLNCA
jgi:hypothetical protein